MHMVYTMYVQTLRIFLQIIFRELIKFINNVTSWRLRGFLRTVHLLYAYLYNSLYSLNVLLTTVLFLVKC